MLTKLYIAAALARARYDNRPLSARDKAFYRNILALERSIRLQNANYAPMTPLAQLAHWERRIRAGTYKRPLKKEQSS